MAIGTKSRRWRKAADPLRSVLMIVWYERSIALGNSSSVVCLNTVFLRCFSIQLIAPFCKILVSTVPQTVLTVTKKRMQRKRHCFRVRPAIDFSITWLLWIYCPGRALTVIRPHRPNAHQQSAPDYATPLQCSSLCASLQPKDDTVEVKMVWVGGKGPLVGGEARESDPCVSSWHEIVIEGMWTSKTQV